MRMRPVSSACGHAEPKTSESEARHQRQFAAGVGPRRQWKSWPLYVVRVAPWPRMARFTRLRISGIL